MVTTLRLPPSVAIVGAWKARGYLEQLEQLEVEVILVVQPGPICPLEWSKAWVREMQPEARL